MVYWRLVTLKEHLGRCSCSWHFGPAVNPLHPSYSSPRDIPALMKWQNSQALHLTYSIVLHSRTSLRIKTRKLTQWKDNRTLKTRKCCIIYLPIILMPAKHGASSLLTMSSSSKHPQYKDQLTNSAWSVLIQYQTPKLHKGTKLTPPNKYICLNPAQGTDLHSVNYTSL